MRIPRILGTTAMVIVCAIAVAFAGLSLMSRGAPSDTRTWAGGLKPFVVLSGSMEPSVHVGSVLLVKRVDPRTVKAGDIITFITPQEGSAILKTSVTTHRVIAVTNDAQGNPAFSTKGDANEDSDMSPVSGASVLGSAVFSVPYLGYVSRFASTKTGLLVLIVGPAVLLIVMELGSMFGGRSHKHTTAPLQEAE